MKLTLENCKVEIDSERGVAYIFRSNGNAVFRISNLTPRQVSLAQIDVRAQQPRSENETVYGWAQDGPVPASIKERHDTRDSINRGSQGGDQEAH